MRRSLQANVAFFLCPIHAFERPTPRGLLCRVGNMYDSWLRIASSNTTLPSPDFPGAFKHDSIKSFYRILLRWSFCMDGT